LSYALLRAWLPVSSLPVLNMLENATVTMPSKMAADQHRMEMLCATWLATVIRLRRVVAQTDLMCTRTLQLAPVLRRLFRALAQAHPSQQAHPPLVPVQLVYPLAGLTKAAGLTNSMVAFLLSRKVKLQPSLLNLVSPPAKDLVIRLLAWNITPNVTVGMQSLIKEYLQPPNRIATQLAEVTPPRCVEVLIGCRSIPIRPHSTSSQSLPSKIQVSLGIGNIKGVSCKLFSFLEDVQ
jgi:hypothetical protein